MINFTTIFRGFQIGHTQARIQLQYSPPFQSLVRTRYLPDLVHNDVYRVMVRVDLASLHTLNFCGCTTAAALEQHHKNTEAPHSFCISFSMNKNIAKYDKIQQPLSCSVAWIDVVTGAN